MTDSDNTSSAPIQTPNRLHVQHDGLFACLLSYVEDTREFIVCS